MGNAIADLGEYIWTGIDNLFSSSSINSNSVNNTNISSSTVSMSNSLLNVYKFENVYYYQLVNTQDPYARPGQKKQGRELKNKARARFTTRIKFRGGRKPPKHHTPGKEHRKYLWWLLWRFFNYESDNWWNMD